MNQAQLINFINDYNNMINNGIINQDLYLDPIPLIQQRLHELYLNQPKNVNIGYPPDYQIFGSIYFLDENDIPFRLSKKIFFLFEEGPGPYRMDMLDINDARNVLDSYVLRPQRILL